MQPDTLARLFNKSGGGASGDGLFQRFLLYIVSPAKDANFSVEVTEQEQQSYYNLFANIESWNTSSGYKFDAELTAEARDAHQEYVNNIRVIAARTPAPRFREHLNKFQAFVVRVALALHVLECAEKGKYTVYLSLDTYNRAKRIMGVLYRHSENSYLKMDETAPIIQELVKGAAEMILSKGLTDVRMGDFTREATGWRKAENRVKQEALDQLIELGWLVDITPESRGSGRGRPSAGLFAVNPKALEQFKTESERIKTERAQRYESIRAVASTRRKESAY